MEVVQGMAGVGGRVAVCGLWAWRGGNVWEGVATCGRGWRLQLRGGGRGVRVSRQPCVEVGRDAGVPHVRAVQQGFFGLAPVGGGGAPCRRG